MATTLDRKRRIGRLGRANHHFLFSTFSNQFASNFFLMSYTTSPSCSSGSSQSDDETCRQPLTATQILAIAIQKRRALFNSKERDYRRELMHTTVIQTLCKHLGEGRAKRRRRAKKRSLVGHDEATETKKSCLHPSIQSVEQKFDAPSAALADEDRDPFGLDQFFANIYDNRNKQKGCAVLQRFGPDWSHSFLLNVDSA
ncbi:unnamed protein product, partial [Mesorhabditis belari]|uniref:Uncharacterized protein n=1 Tax=Mesorhabditis belari TaxID=2138241 RepID=A0AAF3FTV3_9BILA